MLTREEKETQVIQLYEQGKSIREIAHELHLSFSTISSLIKRHTGEANAEIGKKETEVESKDSRVFKLFEDGKTPIQAVIESGLNAEEVLSCIKSGRS
jgi:IS30 family transposase